MSGNGTQTAHTMALRWDKSLWTNEFNTKMNLCKDVWQPLALNLVNYQSIDETSSMLTDGQAMAHEPHTLTKG